MQKKFAYNCRTSWTGYIHQILKILITVCSYLVEKQPKLARRGTAKCKHVKVKNSANQIYVGCELF